MTCTTQAGTGLVLPDGQPLPNDVRMVGRGPDLHVFHGTDWYLLSLTDIPLP